ncbi:MAG TPA: bifunctional 4-hydroxy-2-oxoglutarate aldolase/2-dehydro-3-deoxy-phosphogluconate aldolase, partial [Gemmatimonadaceae bacterium]|nr:bifunctional 4-hydroxy-2-oxoglutarate aldolase/2-dehydro-3-deoxy-phosphogluconate aldolase [Gemmatimonadaceae bacterium]
MRDGTVAFNTDYPTEEFVMSSTTDRTPLPLPPRALVAVLRAPTAEHFLSASKIMWDAGISCFEYTLTSEGALDALVEARRTLPDAVVGVGTVRTPEHLKAAADAGAPFAVSQFFLPELVAAAKEYEIPYVPGTLTPTEVIRAWNTGVSAVKVSPIGSVGGVTYLNELRGPMPDVAIMPTGGVTLEAAAEYLAAGAVAVGVSGALLEDALLGGDLAALKA